MMEMIFDIKMFDVDYRIIVVRSEGYESVLRHSHSFVEFVYVENGRAIHSIGNRTIEIKKGDFFVISTDDAHSIKPVCEEKDFKIINIVCDKHLFKDVTFPPPYEIFRDSSQIYASLVEKIDDEFSNINPSEYILELYIKSVLNLFEAEALSKIRKINTKSKKRRNISYYINKATAYIHENYMNKITLNEIADEVGLYPAYLQKIFRENRSTGVIEYLIHYRMEKSTQFLMETDFTVEEICSNVGINDPKNFYKTFKKYFSASPAEYRKKFSEVRKKSKMKKIEGVIFDLDGVLIHTDNYHYHAWKSVADKLGIEFTEKDNNRLRGVSRMQSLDIVLEKHSKQLSKQDKEQLADEKNEFYKKLLLNIKPEDVSAEVINTLDEIKAMGKKLAIGSSSKNARLILELTNLEGYFDCISDGNNIEKSKPDPEVFLKAAQCLNLSPQNCLIVEDAEAGIKAAHDGGFMSCGIGEASLCDETDFRLGSIKDILAVIKN